MNSVQLRKDRHPSRLKNVKISLFGCLKRLAAGLRPQNRRTHAKKKAYPVMGLSSNQIIVTDLALKSFLSPLAPQPQ